MAKRAPEGLLYWLAVATAVLLLDQFTKILILANFRLGEAVELTNWLSIMRAHNEGAAFSILAGASGWQRWFFIVLGIGFSLFMVVLMRSHANQRLFCLALAFFIGGALGNVLDRIWHGYVVDMIDFHIGHWHFPVFNLADSALTLGVIFMLLDEVRRVRRSR